MSNCRPTLPISEWCAATMAVLAIAAASAPGSAAIRDAAPVASREFPALRLDRGGAVPIAALRGHPAIVNFWASWCIPCRAELASLERLAARRPGRIEVIAASVDDDPAAARIAFGAAYPHLRLAFASLRDVESYGALGMPYSVVLDPEGREVRRVTRAIDWTGADGAGILALAGRGAR